MNRTSHRAHTLRDLHIKMFIQLIVRVEQTKPQRKKTGNYVVILNKLFLSYEGDPVPFFKNLSVCLM